MSNLRMHSAALAAAILVGGCVVVPTQAAPVPVRLDELVALSKQGLGDDAVVGQLAQRGVAFVLAPEDLASLREAGVSEGVLRYLQGRADADAALGARIRQGRYSAPSYYGAFYSGYPYLGYAGSMHYYGEPGYHVAPRRPGYPGGPGWHGGGYGGHGRSHGGGGRH